MDLSMPLKSKLFLKVAVVLTLMGLTFTSVRFFYLSFKKNELGDEEFAVAKVDGEVITKLQFQATQNRMMMAKLSDEGVVRGTDTFDLRLQVFDSLVKDLVLKQWAIQEKILGDVGKDAEIQRKAIKKLDKMKARIMKAYNTDNPEVYFEEFIKAAGFPSVQAFLEETKMSFLEDELAAKIFPDEKATRGEILRSLPVARARQIYIPYTSETNAEVRTQMESLLAQIKKTKPDSRERRDLFIKLAFDNSLDEASRNKGGDIGFLKEADIGDPTMRQNFMELKEGEVSEIFSTGTGYHILYLEFRPEWNEKSEVFQNILKTSTELMVKQKQKRKFMGEFQRRLSELANEGKMEILDPLLEAQLEDRKGNLPRALELYEVAAKLDPENPYIDLAMGEIYFKQNNWVSAKEKYEKAISKRNDDPYLYLRRAKYYLQLGQVNEAVLDLSVASNYAPADFQLHAFLEKQYRNMGMMPEAEQEKNRYLKAVEKIYGNAEALVNQEKLKEGVLQSLGEDAPFQQEFLEED